MTRASALKPAAVLKTDAAAEYLSLSRGRLAKLRWAGGGPKFIRVGRTVLYRTADLEAWLEANSRHSTSQSKQAA
jgi:excisionase family DNA binding protein